ncbi:MAG: hypothetical protein N7Q72_02065, partial [Spiroplasma sp. Tabriz.8]|nr:hypothetical protein [Spiroplasma sp. Tabriz.8]
MMNQVSNPFSKPNGLQYQLLGYIYIYIYIYIWVGRIKTGSREEQKEERWQCQQRTAVQKIYKMYQKINQSL